MYTHILLRHTTFLEKNWLSKSKLTHNPLTGENLVKANDFFYLK